MAGGLGFEPRLTESESAVLPLNYPPNKALVLLYFSGRMQNFAENISRVLQILGPYRAKCVHDLGPFLDQLEARAPGCGDGNLVAESHIAIDHLLRHADFVGYLIYAQA